MNNKKKIVKIEEKKAPSFSKRKIKNEQLHRRTVARQSGVNPVRI